MADVARELVRSKMHYRTDMQWCVGSTGGRSLSVAIFMAIKDICLYKKLAGDPYDMMANGQEIRESVTGQTDSYASYWLQRTEVRAALDRLTSIPLLKKNWRSSAPYGYGDDEQYWLTGIGKAVILEAKTNNRIREVIENFLIEEQVSRISKWLP